MSEPGCFKPLPFIMSMLVDVKANNRSSMRSLQIFIAPQYNTRGGGHCIGDCTPTHNHGQSKVKRSRQNFEAGQAVKLGGTGGSLRTVKVSQGDRCPVCNLKTKINTDTVSSCLQIVVNKNVIIIITNFPYNNIGANGIQALLQTATAIDNDYTPASHMYQLDNS